MATIATMAMLKPKTFTLNSSHTPSPKTAIRPISLLSLKNLTTNVSAGQSLTAAAIAGAVFSTLTHADAAFAAQQIADIAEGDNRGIALLIPIIPAILWVLYNILQPALNQLNRMRSDKGIIVGLGLGLGGGLAGAGFLSTPSASAEEITAIAAAAGDGSGDSRGLLLLFVVAPAIGWVLYNILQPALNQINRMRSG
ncbi:photosystem II reaction center proteins PsbY, chloroplastic-like [Typha angustifolia]|uniref:photosystem II reaction center proteins PsbY, chloroplastic-like n=1 Tax=Typha angustifolia TaxID=59011 RepID=UPI003C2E0557